LSCFREPPPQQQVPQVSPEVVRSIVREVIHEMQKHGRSPHDSPQVRQASSTSLHSKQNSKPKL
jgi:hypothetical protein